VTTSRPKVALRWWLALVTLTGGLWVGLTSGIAVADCPGRSLTVNPHSVPQGSSVTIRGEGWFGSCVDSGGACTKTGVFDPEQDIKLSIVLRNSGGLGRVLAVVDANENSAFVVRKSLPGDLLRFLPARGDPDGRLGWRCGRAPRDCGLTGPYTPVRSTTADGFERRDDT
jgi:hypothetical protein